MAEVAIRGVTKRFGAVIALSQVSLDIADGEFVCVVGHSGCGKTTLLNILAGLLPPSDGEITIGGRRAGDPDISIGVVFQEYALFPWRTALGNVEFGLEMIGVSRAERRERARRFLDLVRLERFHHHYPHELSGGMKQRVAVARAMAYEPALLLMDEPFGALDTQTRERLQELVQEVWRQTRKTVFYVTHNLAEAVYLADRIVVMSPNPGRVRTIVPVDLARPRDALSLEFVALQRRITAEVGH